MGITLWIIAIEQNMSEGTRVSRGDRKKVGTPDLLVKLVRAEASVHLPAKDLPYWLQALVNAVIT